MTMKFVWWNTSLSPPRGKKVPTDEEYIIATDVINYFANVMEADVFALCEVDEPDIDLIYGACNLSEYEVVYDFDSIGNGSYFDIALFFRRSHFKLVESNRLFASENDVDEKKIKAALEVILESNCLGSNLHLMLSHWSSRMHRTPESSESHNYGAKLRSFLTLIFDQYETIPPVVLMGDYNDEPFNRSLSEGLISTRDYLMLKKKPRVLYNSFWKDMGYRLDCPWDIGGSYYYRDGRYSKWYTFDQIIFSSYFLKEKDGWAVNRGMTKVFAPLKTLPSVLDRRLRFDHLPVMSFVERV